MLLIRFILIFLYIFFIFPSSIFKLYAVDADYFIARNNCKPGMTVNISHGLVALNQISLLMQPAAGAPEVIPYGGGNYKVTEIKGEYAKLEGNHKGWLRVNKQVGWKGSVGKLSLNKVCAEQSQSTFSNNKTIPVKYDTTSTFALNADIGSNFIVLEEATQELKANAESNYQKNLVKEGYYFAITDFYSGNLPFAAYGGIVTSNKSPLSDWEIDDSFESVKQDLNLSSYSSNEIEFTDDQIGYHFKEFKYYKKDLWEWLTGSEDVDYFKDFNNCFTAYIHDKPRNNRTITFAATVTSCHKENLT